MSKLSIALTNLVAEIKGCVKEIPKKPPTNGDTEINPYGIENLNGSTLLTLDNLANAVDKANDYIKNNVYFKDLKHKTTAEIINYLKSLKEQDKQDFTEEKKNILFPEAKKSVYDAFILTKLKNEISTCENILKNNATNISAQEAAKHQIYSLEDLIKKDWMEHEQYILFSNRELAEQAYDLPKNLKLWVNNVLLEVKIRERENKLSIWLNPNKRKFFNNIKTLLINFESMIDDEKRHEQIAESMLRRLERISKDLDIADSVTVAFLKDVQLLGYPITCLNDGYIPEVLSYEQFSSFSRYIVTTGSKEKLKERTERFNKLIWFNPPPSENDSLNIRLITRKKSWIAIPQSVAHFIPQKPALISLFSKGHNTRYLFFDEKFTFKMGVYNITLKQVQNFLNSKVPSRNLYINYEFINLAESIKDFLEWIGEQNSKTKNARTNLFIIGHGTTKMFLDEYQKTLTKMETQQIKLIGTLVRKELQSIREGFKAGEKISLTTVQNIERVQNFLTQIQKNCTSSIDEIILLEKEIKQTITQLLVQQYLNDLMNNPVTIRRADQNTPDEVPHICCGIDTNAIYANVEKSILEAIRIINIMLFNNDKSRVEFPIYEQIKEAFQQLVKIELASGNEDERAKRVTQILKSLLDYSFLILTDDLEDWAKQFIHCFDQDYQTNHLTKLMEKNRSSVEEANSTLNQILSQEEIITEGGIKNEGDVDVQDNLATAYDKLFNWRNSYQQYFLAIHEKFKQWLLKYKGDNDILHHLFIEYYSEIATNKQFNSSINLEESETVLLEYAYKIIEFNIGTYNINKLINDTYLQQIYEKHPNLIPEIQAKILEILNLREDLLNKHFKPFYEKFLSEDQLKLLRKDIQNQRLKKLADFVNNTEQISKKNWLQLLGNSFLCFPDASTEDYEYCIIEIEKLIKQSINNFDEKKIEDYETFLLPLYDFLLYVKGFCNKFIHLEKEVSDISNRVVREKNINTEVRDIITKLNHANTIEDIDPLVEILRPSIHNYNDVNEPINECKILIFDVAFKKLIGQLFKNKDYNRINLLKELLNKLPVVKNPQIHFDKINECLSNLHNENDFHFYKEIWLNRTLAALEMQGTLHECIVDGLIYLLTPEEKNTLKDKLSNLLKSNQTPYIDTVNALIVLIDKGDSQQQRDVILAHYKFIHEKLAPRSANIEDTQKKFFSEALKCNESALILLGVFNERLINCKLFDQFYSWVYVDSFDVADKMMIEDCIKFRDNNVLFNEIVRIRYEDERNYLCDILKKVNTITDLRSKDGNVLIKIRNCCNFIATWKQASHIKEMQNYGCKIAQETFKQMLSLPGAKQSLDELEFCHEWFKLFRIQECEDAVIELKDFIKNDDSKGFFDTLKSFHSKLQQESESRMLKQKKLFEIDTLVNDSVNEKKPHQLDKPSFFSKLNRRLSNTFGVQKKEKTLSLDEADKEIKVTMNNLHRDLLICVCPNDRAQIRKKAKERLCEIAKRCDDKRLEILAQQKLY